jgi:glutamine synthetase
MYITANSKEFLERFREDNVKFINMQFSDMHGIVKNVTIPANKMPDALEYGIWFDGSSIEGFSRIYESDMLLMPDISTYAVIPWLNGESGNIARIICDVYTANNEPYQCDPRYILKKIVKEANDLGYEYKTGPECEFFLFKKENGKIKTSVDHEIEPHDRGQYFDLVLDLGYEVRREMMIMLQKMGIEVETSHHEVAPGQHEISFKYGKALDTADRVMTLKYTLKSIAQKYGLHATFMPKPITGINGNGMHVHQSLFNLNGDNAFYNASDKYNLSEIAYQFLAGQMKNIKGFNAILNPLVNSYKRLVPGFEASTYICWAQRNRSALIRIPQYSPGKERATRMEIRCPDPSSNPYLAFASLLKAGLDGMKNKMMPPPPVEEDVFEYEDAHLKTMKIDVLPFTLGDALAEMEKNPLPLELFGEEFMRKYLRAKKAEWDEFRVQVTEWERQNYLETI